MPRILIVEDDTDLLFLYTLMLSRQGYEVVQAGNTAQALALLRASWFDLVVLDMNLPDLPGIEVVEFLRTDSQLSRIPILVVSANELWRQRVNELGVPDFIVKPVTMANLVNAVNDMLRTTTTLSG